SVSRGRGLRGRRRGRPSRGTGLARGAPRVNAPQAVAPRRYFRFCARKSAMAKMTSRFASTTPPTIATATHVGRPLRWLALGPRPELGGPTRLRRDGDEGGADTRADGWKARLGEEDGADGATTAG